jgi:radical SAM protein with 4Fe4S-binding SPASM domain
MIPIVERPLRDLWPLVWSEESHARRDLARIWSRLLRFDEGIVIHRGRPATAADLVDRLYVGTSGDDGAAVLKVCQDLDAAWATKHGLPLYWGVDDLCQSSRQETGHLLRAVVEDHHRGETPDPPRKVIVELTASCNLDCIMCGIGRNGFQPTRTMPLSRFREVAGRLFPGASVVRLSGLGESTIIPGFRDYLDGLEEYGCRYELVTNLTRSDDALWEDLIGRRFLLLVSCDAGSPRVYEAIRRLARWDVFLHNLRLVAGASAAAGRRADVQCIFTLQQNNIDEIPGTVRLMAQVGAGGVVVNVVKEDRDSSWLLSQRRRIIDRFMEAADLAELGGLSLKLPDHLGTGEVTEVSATPSSWMRCDIPHQEVVVRYDGDLTPCNMMNPYLYGNLFQTDFVELWNGPAARLFRSSVNGPARHSYCRSCYYLN